MKLRLLYGCEAGMYIFDTEVGNLECAGIKFMFLVGGKAFVNTLTVIFCVNYFPKTPLEFPESTSKFISNSLIFKNYKNKRSLFPFF